MTVVIFLPGIIMRCLEEQLEAKLKELRLHHSVPLKYKNRVIYLLSFIFLDSKGQIKIEPVTTVQINSRAFWNIDWLMIDVFISGNIHSHKKNIQIPAWHIYT